MLRIDLCSWLYTLLVCAVFWIPHIHTYNCICIVMLLSSQCDKITQLIFLYLAATFMSTSPFHPFYVFSKKRTGEGDGDSEDPYDFDSAEESAQEGGKHQEKI